MKLTKEEREVILKLRKEQDENSPKKRGYLVKDLYSYPCSDCDFTPIFESSEPFWLCDKNQIDKWKQEFDENFKKVLKKGAEFVCYIINNEEHWYDDENYGVEDMNASWAKKYLSNIKDIEK